MKGMKWEELANILNSFSTGVCKTPDKWSWSWQDWKSDVKQKAARLRRHAAGTRGGPSKGMPITALEERLLSFIGETAESGVTGIINPIEILTVSPDGTLPYRLSEEEEADMDVLIETPAPSTPASAITPPAVRRSACDTMEARAISANERMADAMEQVASALQIIAASTKETQEMMKEVASTIKTLSRQ